MKFAKLATLAVIPMLAMVLTPEIGNAQSWTAHQGKDKRGINYANGSIKKGFAEMAVSCVHNSAKVQINLIELPVPKALKKSDNEVTFTLVMDHGGGLARKVAVPAWYYDGEDTWVAQVSLLPNELESFGAAKRFQIFRPNGKHVITFPAKGSRKLQEAMWNRCFL